MVDDFRFEDIVESAHDIIIVTKPDDGDVARQTIVYVNPAFTVVTGYSRREALGKKAKLLELFEDEAERAEVLTTMKDRLPVKATVRSRKKTGEYHWLNLIIAPLKDLNGEYSYFATIERDVTREQELIDKLEELSKTDPLTGLLNRRALQELAQAEISRFQRTGTPFCLLAIDLDYFKKFNDTWGHTVGDRMLKAVAEKLLNQERDYDYVARTGGEEFCILLADTTLEQAGKAAGRVRKLISNIDIVADEEHVVITPSIGIAEITKSDETLDSVLERADKALYHAKDSGRNCVVSIEDGKLTIVNGTRGASCK
jgi:diguanylate cyclase (GGDEF)-like protein/PAS domain S-box-containing protein